MTEGAMLDTDGIMKGSRKMVIIARAHSIGSCIAHHSVLLSLKKEKNQGHLAKPVRFPHYLGSFSALLTVGKFVIEMNFIAIERAVSFYSNIEVRN